MSLGCIRAMTISNSIPPSVTPVRIEKLVITFYPKLASLEKATIIGEIISMFKQQGIKCVDEPDFIQLYFEKNNTDQFNDAVKRICGVFGVFTPFIENN